MAPHFSRERDPVVYACAITRYRRKHRAADIALYVVAVIGIAAALVFNNFH